MENTQQQQRWMDVREAAHYMRISHRSLYNKISSKEFPEKLVKRLGGRLIFDRKQIDKYLESL